MIKIPKNIHLLTNSISKNYQLLYFQSSGDNPTPVLIAFSSEEKAKKWIARFEVDFETWDIRTVFAIFLIRKMTEINFMILDPEPEQTEFSANQVISLSRTEKKANIYQFANFSPLGWTLTYSEDKSDS